MQNAEEEGGARCVEGRGRAQIKDWVHPCDTLQRFTDYEDGCTKLVVSRSPATQVIDRECFWKILSDMDSGLGRKTNHRNLEWVWRMSNHHHHQDPLR